MPADAVTTFADAAIPAGTFGALCLVVTFVSFKLPTFKALEWDNRFFIAVTLAALTNAVSVSYASITSLRELIAGINPVTPDCGPRSIVTAAAPAPVIYACWLTCGYFVQDCLMMALYPTETKKGLGGSAAVKIMWCHHLGSLLSWPWAMLTDQSAVFVTYCLATEITNIGQNLFMLANRGGVKALKAIEAPVGILWMLAFFLVRIVPVPYIAYAYYNTLIAGGGCGLPMAPWIASLIMCPIPVALNMFWFQKIVKKAIRMLGKQQADKKK